MPQVTRRIVDRVAWDMAMGIRVAVDDFGTGYSSLALLDSLDVDLVKIDKRFVASVGRAGSAPEVVTAIIGLSRALGLEMVAEGVETEHQAPFLCANGVQYGPGLAVRQAGTGLRAVHVGR